MSVPKEYEAWAPPSGHWSPWVKPVLFAFLEKAGANLAIGPGWQPKGIPGDSWVRGRSRLARDMALIVDRPDSLDIGLSLVALGFRPIPLHNGCPGESALVDLWPAVGMLRNGTPLLEAAGLPDDAPPAFLLDNRRTRGEHLASPGRFDNRWLAMPQDFPSASRLLSRGITTVTLITPNPPEEDLLHVLLPWRKAGIAVLGTDSFGRPPEDLALRQPSRLGHMAYRFLALMGFRRNSVGGFGSVIPDESAGSGFG